MYCLNAKQKKSSSIVNERFKNIFILDMSSRFLVCPFVCLFIRLTTILYVCLFILFFRVFNRIVCIPPFICLSILPFMSIHQSVHPYVCLIFISFEVSFCLSVHLPLYLFVYSIHLSVCLSTCVPLHLHVYSFH